MSFRTLKIPEGEELLSLPELYMLLYYEAEKLGLDTNQSFFGKDKKDGVRACWLYDFDDLSQFSAGDRDIDSGSALRGVITKKKRRED